MADETEVFDPLETPRCAIHPTDRLVIAGSDPEGRDARWQCPVQGCVYSQHLTAAEHGRTSTRLAK